MSWGEAREAGGRAYQILVLVRSDSDRFIVLVELHALVPLLLLFDAVLRPEACEDLNARALLGLGLLLARRVTDLSAGPGGVEGLGRGFDSARGNRKGGGATTEFGVRCPFSE